MSELRPSVGRVVHYVSYGTPDGEYGKQCRAAIITEVPDQHAEIPAEHPQVGLAVLNPAGMFFNSPIMFDGGDDGGPQHGEGMCDGQHHHGGTWHWPARV